MPFRLKLGETVSLDNSRYILFIYLEQALTFRRPLPNCACYDNDFNKKQFSQEKARSFPPPKRRNDQHQLSRLRSSYLSPKQFLRVPFLRAFRSGANINHATASPHPSSDFVAMFVLS